MATLLQLVDELVLIGNAFEGIKTVSYWDVSDLNQKRVDEYPFLLIERRTPIPRIDPQGNRATYRFIFHFTDQYLRVEEALNKPQIPQSDIQLLQFQYFQEFQRRLDAQTGGDKWDVPVFVSGEYDFNSDNDRLIDLMVTYDISIKGECKAGEFNY